MRGLDMDLHWNWCRSIRLLLDEVKAGFGAIVRTFSAGEPAAAGSDQTDEAGAQKGEG